MRTLVRIAKWLGGLVAAGILFVIIASNFGSVESRWECSGEVRRQIPNEAQEVSYPAKLYANVDTFRWFVFWTRHHAMIKWEIDGRHTTGFGYYSGNDFGTAIVDFNNTKHYGLFSPLSKRIEILPAVVGAEGFEGTCKDARAI